MATRAFSDEDLPMKSTDYHGLATYSATQPDIAEKGIKSANIYLTFDEALKLSLAIQSCVLNLNKISKREAKGRDMGLLLSLKTATKTITVIEATVRQPAANGAGDGENELAT